MKEFKAGDNAWVWVRTTVTNAEPNVLGCIECEDEDGVVFFLKPEQLYTAPPQPKSELTDEERFRAKLANDTLAAAYGLLKASYGPDDYRVNYKLVYEEALHLADAIIAAVKATRKEGAA
ncbi:MAG TPA: hypothetical protein VGM92_01305 [Candidatus Kapabacteria bacterium]|jgi:hypothetical protein